MAPSGSVLELRGVTKQFPGHTAVDNISFSLQPGEFFSLLGPSGCGKTTTLRLIAGFEHPTRGQILLHNHDITPQPPYSRNVSTVFQNYALFPHLTVQQNIEFGLRRRSHRDGIAGQVRRVLDLVQLTGKESRLPSQLSGGERQRTALARSLVLEPAVLLLDEPLSALDPNLRKHVRAELKALQRRVGITFLFVTHDQEEALSLSDRIALMHGGRIEQSSPPEELYLHPCTEFVASFLGSINWFDGVAVRPEATRVSPVAPASTPSRPALIRQVLFLGTHVQLHLLADNALITAEVSRLDTSFSTGQQVFVWWRPEDEMRLPK